MLIMQNPERHLTMLAKFSWENGIWETKLETSFFYHFFYHFSRIVWMCLCLQSSARKMAFGEQNLRPHFLPFFYHFSRIVWMCLCRLSWFNQRSLSIISTESY